MKKTARATKSKIAELASPKGMRDLMNEEYYAFQGFFEKAQEVAVYYGFKPIETPMLEQEDLIIGGIGGLNRFNPEKNPTLLANSQKTQESEG